MSFNRGSQHIASKGKILAIRDAIEKILDSTSDPAAISSEIFPQIDLDQVRKRTRPKENGIEDGNNNQPAIGSETFSACELDIKATFEQYQQRYSKDYHDAQNSYVNRVSAIARGWTLQAIENEEKKLVNDVIAQAKEDAAPIFSTKESLKANSNQLYMFRRTNNLLERLPNIRPRYTILTVIWLFFLAEIAITFVLLRESGDALVVLLLALVYCALNCWAPFWFGRGTRWVNLVWGLSRSSNIKKISGFFVAGAVILGGGVLNLLIGHYRAVSLELAAKAADLGNKTLEEAAMLAMSADQIGIDALKRFQDSPFGLGETWAWLLAGFGFLALVISHVDGYLSDDDYPEYGEKAKSFRDAYEGYQREVEQVIGTLKDNQRQGVDEIKKFKKRLSNGYAKVPEIINRSNGIVSGCKNAMNVLNARYQQLIEEYRNGNRSNRSDAPPHYFNQSPRLPLIELAEPTFPPVDETIKGTLEKTLESFAERLHSEFERLIKEIVPAGEALEKYPLAVEITDGKTQNTG